MVVVVGRWSLFGGGRYSEVVVSSALIAIRKNLLLRFGQGTQASLLISRLAMVDFEIARIIC